MRKSRSHFFTAVVAWQTLQCDPPLISYQVPIRSGVHVLGNVIKKDTEDNICESSDALHCPELSYSLGTGFQNITTEMGTVFICFILFILYIKIIHFQLFFIVFGMM